MKKRVFIVHGWGGKPEDGWRPWLKNELEKNGFMVQLLAMPNTDNPIINEWVGALISAVGKADKNTYLVGHSLGCQAILRYAEQLPKSESLGGVLLVAGFIKSISNIKTPEQEIVIKPWRDTPIDFEKVKRVAGSIHAIFSEGDIWIPIENKQFFEEKIGAKTYLEDGKGERRHLSDKDNVLTLPKALELILAMSATPLISIDDVAKLEIKMGTILTAEKVEGADRLLKFSIDLGSEKRTIVSGVAQYYQPEVMVGKQVPVITNLAPRKMKGIESAGMIIYAIDESVVDGQPGHVTRMLNPDKEVPPGSPVQ
jgi:methionine--tRNA ligase beta chain